LIAILWIICVASLIAHQFTGKEVFALLGDIMLVISFGLTSLLLLRAGLYWIGAAFAFPAVRQLYVLVTPRLRGSQRTCGRENQG